MAGQEHAIFGGICLCMRVECTIILKTILRAKSQINADNSILQVIQNLNHFKIYKSQILLNIKYKQIQHTHIDICPCTILLTMAFHGDTPFSLIDMHFCTFVHLCHIQHLSLAAIILNLN